MKPTILVPALLFLTPCLTLNTPFPSPLSSPTCPLLTLSNTEPIYACTSDTDWTGDGYDNNDCRAAIQRLYFVEVIKYGKQKFEFVLPGATKQTDYPIMHTPRRYTVGKCTLAIVMLDFFADTSLPGQDPWNPKNHDNTDVTSFEELWGAADLVETCCLNQHKSPGWAADGAHESIGVFVWTSKSYSDRQVPQGAPTLRLPSANLTAELLAARIGGERA